MAHSPPQAVLENSVITRAQKELASRTLATIAAGLFIATVIGSVTGTIEEPRDLVASLYAAVNFYACAHIIAGKV